MFRKRNFLTLALLSCAANVYAQGASPPPSPPPAPNALSATISDVKTLEDRVKDLEKDVANIKKYGKFEDIALDKANAASDEVANWSQARLLEIYSYNFMNYQDVIKYIKNFFTQPGYDSYLKALEESKNREILESQKLIVYAIPAGGPVVEKEGVVDGIFEWDVKVPLLVSYRNDHGTIQRKLDVNVIVVRVPYTESKTGYAVHAIRAKEVTEPQANPVATPEPSPTSSSPNASPNLTTPKAVSPKVAAPPTKSTAKPTVKQ